MHYIYVFDEDKYKYKYIIFQLKQYKYIQY